MPNKSQLYFIKTVTGGGFPGFGAVPPAVAPAGSAGSSGLAAQSNHTHAHGNQPEGDGNNHAPVGTFSGFMTPAMLATLNGLVSFPGFGPDVPPAVAAAGAVGDSGLAAQSNHTHAHGAQELGDGTNHAAVTDTFAGFMTPAMLAALTQKKVSFQADAVDAIFKTINLGGGAIPNPEYLARGTHAVLAFDAAAVEGAVWQRYLPTGFATGNNLRVSIYWVSATAVAGDVIWAAAFERDNAAGHDINTESFAALQTAAASTAPGTTGIIAVATITFTQAQADAVAAGEPLRLFVQRTATALGDTMLGDAQLVRVVVEEVAP